MALAELWYAHHHHHHHVTQLLLLAMVCCVKSVPAALLACKLGDYTPDYGFLLWLVVPAMASATAVAWLAAGNTKQDLPACEPLRALQA
jgi:ABC-type polysaccharide/polyol phosphate export permease